MRMGKKVKNFIATVIICSALVAGHPVRAFIIWPTIDATQISTFVSMITQSVSKVANATAQIQSYTATIHAIGDQVSAVAKYVTDLKNEIAKIVSLVNDIMISLSYSVHTMDSVLKDIEAEVSGLETKQVEIANEIGDTIEDKLDDEETQEEDVQKTLDEGLQETLKAQEQTAETIKQAKETISTIATQANESVDKLMGSILNDNILSEEKQKELKQEAEDVKTQIKDMQIHADEVLGKMEKTLNEENKKVADAYKDYSQGISDYYAQKLTREELTLKGNEFKEVVASANSAVDKEALDSLYEEANGVIDSVDKLKEDITNSIANNKGYSDEDDEVDQTEVSPDTDNNISVDNKGRKLDIDKPIIIKDKIDVKIRRNSLLNKLEPVKYVFNFHSVKTHQYSKATIAQQKNTGYYGIDQDFLLSKELVCDSKANVDDLADNPKKSMEWFKDCVIKAKTEKEYWCPKAKDESEIAKCDPFGLSKGLYKDKYKNEGVYKHLYEDYSMANIVGLNKIKQYASTWQDLSDKTSTQVTLEDQLGKIDNTRNAYSLQSVIDLESPQLWSRLRRVDALERSKNAINYFRQQTTLYLDGRPGNEDYSDAQKEEPGTLEVDVGDGETEEKTIMSHMFLHLCGIEADDISVSYENKAQTSKAEENIKNCFFKYANLATRGGEVQMGNSEDAGTSGATVRSRDDVMMEWRGNEIKTLSDSMFDTLYMATVNNFRSSKDYAKLSDKDEVNIVSVQKDLKDAKEARDDYSAGAQINYYSARQMLTIIDADAQSLQTEIIQDMASMSYNFFDMEAKEGEE